MKKKIPDASYSDGQTVYWIAEDGKKLTVKGNPRWNGYTWMYAFHETEARMGEMYISSINMSDDMPSQMKLNPKQREVIEKMRNGWELGTIRAFGVRPILRKGDLEGNGECSAISMPTFNSLRKDGLIRFKMQGQSKNIYLLTELGRTIDIS